MNEEQHKSAAPLDPRELAYIELADGEMVTVREAMRRAALRPKQAIDVTEMSEAMQEARKQEARLKRAASGLAHGPAKAAALRVAAAQQRDIEAFDRWQRLARAMLIVRGEPLSAEARLRKYERTEGSSSPRRVRRLRALLAAGKLPPLK